MFHFKQFSVDQSGCAMKINTDGVLLGALTKADDPKSILDIGTGTGVIALMMGQRFPTSLVDAIEIDAAAAATAENNFIISPFRDRLWLHALSFEKFFIQNPDKKYDLIISNPPFFINALQSPKSGNNLAKHTDKEFFKELIMVGKCHLADKGLMWLIFPVETSLLVNQFATECGLHLHQVINIRSYPAFSAHREIVAFGLQPSKTVSSKFIIYDEPKRYSGQYCTALTDFFTIFP